MSETNYLDLKSKVFTYAEKKAELDEHLSQVNELEKELSKNTLSDNELDIFQRKTESLATLLESIEPRLIKDRHNRARVVIVPATLSYDLSQFYSSEELSQLKEIGIAGWQLKGLCKYKPSKPDAVKIIPEYSMCKFAYNSIRNLPQNFSNGSVQEKANYIVVGGMVVTLGIVDPTFFSCAAIGTGVLMKYILRALESQTNPFSKRADELRNNLKEYNKITAYEKEVSK